MHEDKNLYYAGFWDGLFFLEPTNIDDAEYWRGYSDGVKKYWKNLLEAKNDVTITTR